MSVRVLIVDDSALMQALLRGMLTGDSELQVVGVAKDAYEARAMVKELAPDVLTLDVEMPGMNGLTFLKNLMRLRPLPVVMVSSHTQAGGDVTLEALELGAVDYVTKPGPRDSLTDCAAELIRKIKSAARVPRQRLERLMLARERPRLQEVPNTSRLIAIGASTGGPQALTTLLGQLPAQSPPILVVQHLPLAFSEAFVQRLRKATELEVVLATPRRALKPGLVVVAPGGVHLGLHSDLTCRLQEGEKRSGHRPSVDFLFESLAQVAGPRAVGLLLTGMGVDGAAGLEAIREAGGRTLAQDEETSVIWGMPGEAVARGAAQQVLPLEGLAAALVAR